MGSGVEIIDVGGGRRRNTSGVEEFVYQDGPIPEGPAHVTLRHQPNAANPYSVAVYLDDQRHVGWIGTTWSADAAELLWVRRLAAAGLRPRLRAECEYLRMGGNSYTYLFFYMPIDAELMAVADELIQLRHGTDS